MRISYETYDPGCFNWDHYEDIKVFLDDKLVEEPITADEELGYVKYHLRDSDGNLVLGNDASGNTCPTIQEEYGKVRVELISRKDDSRDTGLIKQKKYGKVRIEPNKFNRISCEDAGYSFEAHGGAKIFLDDVLVKYPITADVRLGYVKYFRCDGEGQITVSGMTTAK